MEVKITSLKGLERKMTVTVPAAEVTQDVHKALNKLKNKARLNGFRPGKIPFPVLIQRFGEKAHQDAVYELTKKTLERAVKEQKLDLVSTPEVDIAESKLGDALSYTATFEVFPTVTLADFKSLTITQRVPDITDKDVDEALEKMRLQHATWEPVNRAAADGDQVTIDYSGSLEGKPFPGGKAHGFQLVLGSHTMIPGFEAGIIGMTPNEKKTLPLTFPAQYHAADLAGKETAFEITVSQVSRPVLPTVDDAFAKQMKVPAGTVAGLRETIRASLQRYCTAILQGDTQQQVIDQLLAAHSIEVPKALLEEQLKRLLHQVPNALDKASPEERQHAQEQATSFVLLREIAKVCKVQVDQNRVNALMQALANNYKRQYPQEWSYEANQPQQQKLMAQQAYAMATEEEIIKKVLEQAQVTDKPTGLAEVQEIAKQPAPQPQKQPQGLSS